MSPPDVAAKVLSDATFDRIEALDRIRRMRGRSLLELAVAWLASLPVVGSVICGATSATSGRFVTWRQVIGGSMRRSWARLRQLDGQTRAYTL